MNALGDLFVLPRPRDLFSAAFLDDVKRLRVLATEGVPGGFEDDEEEELEEQEELTIDTDEELVRLKKLYLPRTAEDPLEEDNEQGQLYGDEEEEDDDENQEAAAEEEEAREAHLEHFRKLIRRKLRRKAIAEKLNTLGRIKSGLSRANLQEYGLMFRSKECVPESRRVEVLQCEYMRQAFFLEKKAVEDPDPQWVEENCSSRSSVVIGSGPRASSGSTLPQRSITSQDRNASILDILQGTSSFSASPLALPHELNRVSSAFGGSSRFPPLTGLSAVVIPEGGGGGNGPPPRHYLSPEGGITSGGAPSLPSIPWAKGRQEGLALDGMQESPLPTTMPWEGEEQKRMTKPMHRSGATRGTSPESGLSISTNTTTAAAPLTEEATYEADTVGREEGGGAPPRLPHRSSSFDTKFSPSLAIPQEKALLTVHWKPSKRSTYPAYPLHWAVMGRSHRAIRYLIKNGADPELSAVLGLLPKDIATANGLHETLHVLEMSMKEYKEMLQKDDEEKKKIESELEQLKAAKERRKMEREQRIMTRREQVPNEVEEEEEGDWE